MLLEGEVDDIVSESSSILSTAATDGSSVPPSVGTAAATAVSVGPGLNGSLGDDNRDRYSKMDCTGSRGDDLRWGLESWEGRGGGWEN